MNQSSALQSIAASWATPGFSLIVCDPEQSSLFWYQFRLRQGSSTNGAATHKIMNLPANAGDFAQWSGELSQSFLGNSQVYWGVLPAPTTKTQKVRQLVITFLKNYTGPHAIWLVAHEDQVSDFGTCRRTVVASQMSMQEIGACARFLGFERSAKVVAACSLSGAKATVPLDAAVSLLWHAEYVPMRSPQETTDFLERLLPEELSLTQLADLFFKKEWPQFLDVWQVRAPAYGDMFWVSFWAEQLWRAYWVCWYMKRGQQTRARSMGYRLPASFMQSGWQQCDLATLRAQYERVAFFDTSLKQGSFLSTHELVTGFIA